MTLHIVHLYPETLGLYGDGGNVLALRKRCEWRGIDFRVSAVELGQAIPVDGDIYVIGSGSSNGVRRVGSHVDELGPVLGDALTRQASVLAVGAGLHLLSERIESADGSVIPGAGLVAGRAIPLATRRVGEFVGVAGGAAVAGFVNTGHEIVTEHTAHITDVYRGPGDHRVDSDGVEFGTFIGTHSHGPYLPMNPHIADAMIARASGSRLEVSHPNMLRADLAAARSRDAIAARLGL